MKINLNDSCYVKLTPAGVEQYYNHQRQQLIPEQLIRHPKRFQTTDWYEFQLWDLMNIFGSTLHLGTRMLPFEDNSILFEKPI